MLLKKNFDKNHLKSEIYGLQRVDKKLTVSEDFLGLYNVPKIDSETLVMIKDCLLRLNLSLSKARGQCYDGHQT